MPAFLANDDKLLQKLLEPVDLGLQRLLFCGICRYMSSSNCKWVSNELRLPRSCSSYPNYSRCCPRVFRLYSITRRHYQQSVGFHQNTWPRCREWWWNLFASSNKSHNPQMDAYKTDPSHPLSLSSRCNHQKRLVELEVTQQLQNSVWKVDGGMNASVLASLHWYTECTIQTIAWSTYSLFASSARFHPLFYDRPAEPTKSCALQSAKPNRSHQDTESMDDKPISASPKYGR